MGARVVSVLKALPLVSILGIFAAALDSRGEEFSGKVRTRTYYVAAEELEWDYAPRGNLLREMRCGENSGTYLEQGRGRIGSKYRKALLREYTDESFADRKSREPAWEHLGILGPLLRAEVGDRIQVVFRNKTQFRFSLHAHGVFYLKGHEGAGYEDGTAGKDREDDAIAPNGGHTYIWDVPDRAGPGPADPSSVAWLYHSHVHSPKDTNAGLIGVILVTSKGKARPDGSPRDIDHEFVTLFNIFDENESWYLDYNTKTYADHPDGVKPANDEFKESNLKHAINGYLFGNLPVMTSRQGDRVRWYLVAMGTEADLHTPHWHGNTVLHDGHRTDVIELLPASMKVADMKADNPGVWMFHCHVNDHITAGMAGRYEVLK